MAGSGHAKPRIRLTERNLEQPLPTTYRRPEPPGRALSIMT